MSVNLFGFEIGRQKKKIEELTEKTFALPTRDDGAVVIQSGAYYGTFVDLDGTVRNEIELITRYRDMSLQPEVENAIDDIVNEAIVLDDDGESVNIKTDDLKQPDKIKKKISDEFEFILKLLDFSNTGHDIFRRWYVDGRMFYHVVIDEKSPTKGIKEIRYIDPRRIRKIREIQKTKDPRTGIEIIKSENEYYLYNERGVVGAHSNLGAKIATDSIVNVNSGLMDSKRTMVLSYLHKAIKPLNQLRMIEDATVIYKISRAPERRVFYIDVGNMPTAKAEQYLRDTMVKYRNKLVYDANTGEIKDDRKHMSMLEDFWLPRREGGKGTEISTLPAGVGFNDMTDVQYFQKNLYKALGVPISRLEPQQGFSLGRTTEISRDELKFNKFVQRLRAKFSTLFDDLLRTQLVLKRICTVEEWEEFKEDIVYDFKKDNNFTELKEAELLSNRVQILTMIDPFVGKYYSPQWVRKNVLRQTEEDMEQIDKEIDEWNQAHPQPQIDPMTGQPIDPNAPQPVQGGLPPPVPQQSQNATVPQEDGSMKDQEDPLLNKKKMRFQNDTLEPVGNTR